jgi:hypothetical protein
MHGRDEKCIEISVGNPEGKRPLRDLGVLGKIIDLEEMGWEGVVWVHLVQDRNQWQGLVIVMNLWVP